MDTHPPREGNPVLRLLTRLFRQKVDPIAQFRAQETDLRERFRSAAASRGFPKGLIWAACDANGAAVFVRDTTARETLVALLPVLIQFEPLPAMADVPAAREPRPVVAIMRYVNGEWHPDVAGIFNLTVVQIIEKSGGRYILP